MYTNIGFVLSLMLSTKVAKNPPAGGGVVMSVNLWHVSVLAPEPTLKLPLPGTPTLGAGSLGSDLLLTFIMVGLKNLDHQSRSTNATSSTNAQCGASPLHPAVPLGLATQ